MLPVRCSRRAPCGKALRNVTLGVVLGFVLSIALDWRTRMILVSEMTLCPTMPPPIAQIQHFPENNYSKVYTDGDIDAKQLAEKVRVLIWVMTQPKNHQLKATVVRDTWGRRANKLLFFSSTSDGTIPTIGLNVSEGRKHLAAKSQKAWRYIYKHHFHDAEWFMKADDDTFVILENLRYFLAGEDPTQPVHYGQLFHKIVKQGFYSGGSGYVLSKEAFRRYGELGEEGAIKLCRQDGAAEDAAMGDCMQKLGVRIANTTDIMGRSRFHCFKPEVHLNRKFPSWFSSYDPNGGHIEMSHYAISFHYMNPDRIRAMYFMLYHLHVHGLAKQNLQVNRSNTTYWTQDKYRDSTVSNETNRYYYDNGVH